ncbi:MAG: hypothetical protein QHC67_15285 [Sphingobium sp.]|uniref:hypothetical protein n=1 Tax=Sphingobium sp. TaxID=1912891 RepID=UPI0029A84193|nr:hypothetical protein [Sphingobium sp.]MDX3911162.1 hypothetical protein [Sphingobium sp.]
MLLAQLNELENPVVAPRGGIVICVIEAATSISLVEFAFRHNRINQLSLGRF